METLSEQEVADAVTQLIRRFTGEKTSNSFTKMFFFFFLDVY